MVCWAILLLGVPASILEAGSPSVPMTLTNREIGDKYDAFAAWYDRSQRFNEWLLGVTRFRRELIGQASGEVLEVAAGTGRNFPFYSARCRITAVDVSPLMLARAEVLARRTQLDASFAVMEAEALAFPDASFDTVVSTLSTCTFPDPVKALHEMGRVSRSDGRILLLEHGHSNRRWLASLQDRFADRQAKALGCHWNREPLELVRQAGLDVVASRRTRRGVYHSIRAKRQG